MPGPSQIMLGDECHSQQPKRVHRPPNAFILYRSDFLKRGTIPPDVEKRQQNLSRIAGKCWKMLPDAEKAIWYDKAAAIRAEHRFEHYRSRPLYKNKNRLSAKDQKGSVSNSWRSPGCPSGSQTQASFYENVFSAFAPPTSHTRPSSSILTSESSSSTTPSISPLPLAHLLPSFTSYTNSSPQDALPTAFENLQTDEFDDSLQPSTSKVAQDKSRQIRDPKNVFGEIGSFQLYPAPRQHEWGFATYGPFCGLEQTTMHHGYPVSQISPDLSESDTFSSMGHSSELSFIFE